jgi:hypothetical protein
MFSFTKFKIVPWLVSSREEVRRTLWHGFQRQGDCGRISWGHQAVAMARRRGRGEITLMADAYASKIKNIKYSNNLNDYLNRVRPYMQNYAMQACLGP